MIENLVIGSGPVGITAAKKVLSLNISCTLIDAGDEIETEKQNLVEDLRAKNFSDWNLQDKRNYRRLSKSEPRLKSHVGSKLLFGSSFPYANYKDFQNSSIFVRSTLNVYPSLASGGLANVWGSICLPYTESDSRRLRIPPGQKDYDFIDEFLPIAGREDGLSGIYSLPSQIQNPVSSSNFGSYLREKFPCIKDSLPFQVFGGTPRVAVHTKGKNKCQDCGLCATGCVWGSIWDAKSEIIELKKNAGFSHIQSLKIDKIVKYENHYEVHGEKGELVTAKRIFLAAGPIGTAIILQKSALLPREIFLSDTQLTILPCLVMGRRQTENNFVLSQYLLNFPTEKEGTDCFVQITGYNPDLVRRIRGYFTFARLLPSFLLDEFFRHLGIAMIFQNANSSGQVRISNESSTISLSAIDNPKANIFKLGLFKNITRTLKRLNMIPLGFLAQIVGVGESYHMGRMANKEGELILSTIGEIAGVEKLHIIDSSALDYIAPGPITYIAMANAARIVEEVIGK